MPGTSRGRVLCLGSMDALLVDQVMAVYVVVAVAMAILGGIYAYVWRLSAMTGLSQRRLGLGFAGMVVLWLVLAAAAAARVFATVEPVLVLAALAILSIWALIFYFLWELDRTSRT